MKTRNKKFKEISNKSKNKCFYCGISLIEMEENNSYSIDHLIPIKKGGGNELGNLVLSCRKCNSKKGTMTYQQFSKIEKIKSTPKYKKYILEHNYFITLFTSIKKNEI